MWLKYCVEHTYTKKLLVVCLKFQFNWASCILSGNRTQGEFESASPVKTEALNTTPSPPRSCRGRWAEHKKQNTPDEPKQSNRENKKGQHVTPKKAFLSWGSLDAGSHLGTGLGLACGALKAKSLPPGQPQPLWAFLQVHLGACTCPVEKGVLYVYIAPTVLTDKKHASTRHSCLHIPPLGSRCIHWIESIWSIFCSNKVLSQEAHYCLITRRQLLNIIIINCCKLTCLTPAVNFMLLQGNYAPWLGVSNTPLCHPCSSFTGPYSSAFLYGPLKGICQYLWTGSDHSICRWGNWGFRWQSDSP